MKNVRLIALDMDGTLLAEDKTIPKENVDAIRRAEKAGIRVCICTGRLLEDASDYAKRMGLPCMIIAANGTRAADKPLPEGWILLRKQFEPKDAHTALDILIPRKMMINAFEDGLATTICDSTSKVYHLSDRGVIKAQYGEENMRKAADHGIMKLFVVCHEEDGFAPVAQRVAEANDALRQALPHLQITSSAEDNIEIMPADASKGMALEQVAQMYGLKRENVMAVGDAPNDLSMLEYAYHSVAMGNAMPEIKRVCRYETATNDECGVARIIERVLEAQVKR